MENRQASGRSFRQRIYSALKLDQLSPGLRRVFIGLIGGTVFLIGLAFIILPGPAFIVIPLGLAILASEFMWARKALVKTRKWFRAQKNRFRQRRQAKAAGSS
jgi:hypothetical protein